MSAALVLYRCCEHCGTDESPCRHPDEHIFRYYEGDTDDGLCVQGSQFAEAKS